MVEIQRRSRYSGPGRLDLPPEFFGLVYKEFLCGGERNEDILFQAENVIPFTKRILAEGKKRFSRPVLENDERNSRGMFLLGVHCGLDLLKEGFVEEINPTVDQT